MSLQARFRLDWPGFRLDVDLDLPGQGVTALYGPSGSGKTTLLRCIAGLDRAPDGRLRVNGEVWQEGPRWLPPHRRPLGYVFQEPSLFPHLSVLGNLRYGQRRSSAGQRVSLEQAVDLLGIAHLLERRPDRLSGGERQRVAIARALAVNPRILLMDEPLAALDGARKRELLPYLETLHRTLAIPVLYVSHAPEEVARLADHLVVLAQGRVRVAGPLGAVLGDMPSAGGPGIEIGTVLETRLRCHDADNDLSCLDFSGGALWVARRPEAPGSPVRCRILPEDVGLALERPLRTSILNCLPAQVLSLEETDIAAHRLVRLRAGEAILLARITRKSAHALNLQAGQTVYAMIKAVSFMTDTRSS